MAIDVRTASNELVAQVRSDQFVGQLELALPETVSARRFARIAITAIQQNPDLAKCDRDSVARALLRCAADGLLPDGREAALVKFGNDAAYLPMIGGYRKIAADHGWTLRTRVVHENDTFDYTEEPPALSHTPARPGIERGPLVAAYAIATHADGRRLQRIMYAVDIDKRKAVARSKNVWEQWPEPMWEKTVGRDLFNELPLGDFDHERIQAMIAADVAIERAAADPVGALYGREIEGSAVSSDRAAENGATGLEVRAGEDGDAEAGGGGGAAASPGPASAPTDEEAEDAVWEPAGPTAEEVAKAGELKVASGVHVGKTIAQVASEDDGPKWLLAQLRKTGHPVEVETFVRGQLPETWATYQAWLTEES